MTIYAWIASIRDHYAKLSHREKPVVGLLATVLGLLVIILLMKGCIAIVFNHKIVENKPLMLHQRNKIFVPEYSALRSQIIVMAVSVESIPHIVSVPGVVEMDPTRVVNILPPLTGRLMRLPVNLGQWVKRHQVLAEVSSPALAQAYSDRDKALSAFKLAEATLGRTKKVFEAGANSIKDIQSATNDYVQAKAELQRTELTLKTLGNKGFNRLIIKAPFEGLVTAINYGKGSYLNDTSTPLLTIMNNNAVWVTANIPENLVGITAKGQAVEVLIEAYPKQVLQGTVSFVSPFLEPDTRRNKTRILFKNPNHKLQSNMFATVKISVEQPKQILIPHSAILMNDDATSVYVEIAPWTFVRRRVVLGHEDAGKVRVESGLNAGDRVVISGGIFVND